MPKRFAFCTLLMLFIYLGSQAQTHPDSSWYYKSYAVNYAGEGFFDMYPKFLSFVRQNDSIGISTLIGYPLRIVYGKHHKFLYNRRDFLRYYHLLFDKRMRDLILSSTTDKLFYNWKGVMIGDGQIWFLFQPNCYNKIGTIDNGDDIWGQ